MTNGKTGSPIVKARQTFKMDLEKKEDSSKKSFSYAEIFKQDGGSILILLLLYVLQGVPLGLAGSIPMLLQARGVSYNDQALFSFVFWPFSLKLIWAPIVDGAFFASFGRRKSWLIPVQFSLALIMYWLSFVVDDLLEKGNVFNITAAFFFLNFFAATQDIAVDGWALTMLSKENRNLASTCNSVGQTAGYFAGYVIFLALESPDFANAYFRTEPLETGLCTLPQYLYFWAIVFVLTTICLIFKEEKPEEEKIDGVMETYKLLKTVLKLDIVKQWVMIILTCKIAFAAVDGVTQLKILDAGVPKEKLAMLAVPMTPVQIILPIFLTPLTNGARPLKLWINSYLPRILIGLGMTAFVFYTPAILKGEEPGLGYLGSLMGISFLHQLTLHCMFVSIMSFHARVSDPSIGGTYMTLLNTVSNMGGNWPVYFALRAVEPLSGLGLGDGYYLECSLLAIFGVFWFSIAKPKLEKLESLDPAVWAVPKAPQKAD